MNSPDNTAENGRDRKTGRFLPGNDGGPGRPRRPDLYAVAAERAAAENVDLETELWAVTKQMISQAKSGDVHAARLLLDRLCIGKDSAEDNSITIQVVTGVPAQVPRVDPPAGQTG